MMELDEYLYGMNRRKIDREKAYGIVIDTPDSESNPVTNVWKAMLADPQLPGYKSSRVEKNQWRANELYRKAVDLNIEQMAEDGDTYACSCLGDMYYYGGDIEQSYPTAVKWYRKVAEQGYAHAQLNIGMMYDYGDGVDENYSAAVESSGARPC